MLAVLERWLPYTVTILDRFHCIYIWPLVAPDSINTTICSYVHAVSSHESVYLIATLSTRLLHTYISTLCH